MLNKPVFYLFIPNLLQSLGTWHQDFLFEVQAPHLSNLLSQFTKTESSNARSLNSAFFQLLDPKTDELPIAYYRHQVQVNTPLNSIICADPVHLEVGMNDVVLTDKIDDLTNDEAKELIGILNEHFTQDGLQFIFGSNECWYVSFSENETVQSHDIDTVLLKNVVDKLAQSEQRNWQVIQNEAQMLLHSSDINQSRENAGLKPVNSLWFWGAGKPLMTTHQFDTIYSSNETASKLRGQLFAKAAECNWQKLPENSTSLIDGEFNGSKAQALLLDQLFMPALETRLDDFQNELQSIDKQIIEPLLQAWKKNQIELVIDCCDGTTLHPKRVPAWKLWSKPTNLREI